jgi:hypothetical protein
VTKFEIVKTKDDIQLDEPEPVLSMLIFRYCTTALCPSCISEEGTPAILSTKKICKTVRTINGYFLKENTANMYSNL